jgi:hypothetical protein
VIRYGKYGRKLWKDMANMEENCEMWNDMENMEENCEKIRKIWKKAKLNSEKICKIQKKLWNDMENTEEN